MKSLVLASTAFLLAWSSIPLVAQESPQPPSDDTAIADSTSENVSEENGVLPTAKEVIDAHLDAVGGEEVYGTVHSLKMIGQISNPSFSATIMICKKDGKTLNKLDFGQGRSQAVGYDGEVAWTNTLGKIAVLEGDEAEWTKKDADLSPLYQFEDKYDRVDCVGREAFNGQDCYVLIFVRGDKESRQYFDVETGLQAGLQTTQEDPQGVPVETTIFFEDYREVAGLKISHSQRMETGVVSMQSEFDVVEINTEIDDEVFQLPKEEEAETP